MCDCCGNCAFWNEGDFCCEDEDFEETLNKNFGDCEKIVCLPLYAISKDDSIAGIDMIVSDCETCVYDSITTRKDFCCNKHQRRE